MSRKTLLDHFKKKQELKAEFKRLEDETRFIENERARLGMLGHVKGPIKDPRPANFNKWKENYIASAEKRGNLSVSFIKDIKIFKKLFDESLEFYEKSWCEDPSKEKNQKEITVDIPCLPPYKRNENGVIILDPYNIHFIMEKFGPNPPSEQKYQRIFWNNFVKYKRNQFKKEGKDIPVWLKTYEEVYYSDPETQQKPNPLIQESIKNYHAEIEEQYLENDKEDYIDPIIEAKKNEGIENYKPTMLECLNEYGKSHLLPVGVNRDGTLNYNLRSKYIYENHSNETWDTFIKTLKHYKNLINYNENTKWLDTAYRIFEKTHRVSPPQEEENYELEEEEPELNEAELEKAELEKAKLEMELESKKAELKKKEQAVLDDLNLNSDSESGYDTDTSSIDTSDLDADEDPYVFGGKNNKKRKETRKYKRKYFKKTKKVKRKNYKTKKTHRLRKHITNNKKRTRRRHRT